MLRLGLLLLGLFITSAAAGPGSCMGRCGEPFTRGRQCTCDLNCLQHNECCPDFEATCVTARSCQGRCGEAFRRGLSCQCDPLCIRYNTCCPDYQTQCDATVTASHHGNFQPLRAKPSRNRKSEKNQRRSNSESEETYIARGRCPQYAGGQCQGTYGLHNLLAESSSGSASPAVPTNHQQNGGSNIPIGLLPMPIPSSSYGAPHFLASDPSLSSHNILGSNAPMRPSTSGATAGKLNVHLVLSSGGVRPSGPNQGVDAPAGTRPSTLQDVAQALSLSMGEAGPEGSGTGLSAQVDLCSDSPINGLTSLLDGTILIFKGELFWSVDPVSGSVGHPQNITESLGISPPIDTIFTRSNCEGNVYIIKGDQYWRLDRNMVMQPGFPKPLASEFPGLTGSISAALAVPATRNRPEIVFFFKNDIVQKFTFPPGSTPSCREKPRSSLKNLNRPAEVLLSGEINIKLSLKGFPTPVTSALSVPSPQGNNRYQHFVFSGPLFFRVQISGDLPSLAKPDPPAALTLLPFLSPTAMPTNSANMGGWNPSSSHPTNSIRFLLHCP
ncbi:proteoglycan 4a isoform X2 [Melanotaenia boesemani]|uniref:proteoglycan 4a isoform X2 n=1 Tax=Melanotaenia boesemani TaxID=1250792 RepID=UPI001C04AFE4|nr:proteoglycan 4a isoform X2 [Melanotaenia boesemani]